MAGYDPQRTRHRPRPTNGTAAPVDSILDGPAEADDPPEPEPTEPHGAESSEAAVEHEGTTEVPPVSAPSVTPEPVAPSIDLSSVPAPSSAPSPARLAVGGSALALLLALLWWWLRHRPTED